MTLSTDQIDELKASHRPQPTQGVVSVGFHVALDGETYRIWDDRQTSGYLCSTQNVNVLTELLSAEAESRGSVRELITGEPSPWIEIQPALPRIAPETPSSINLADLLGRTKR